MVRSIDSRSAFIGGVLAILTLSVYSQPRYKVSDIPKELLINAKAVVRNSETYFEVTDLDKAVKRVTYAITILNQNGVDKSVFYDFYDKFRKIKKFDWTMYDQDGNKIKKNTNIQLQDYSAISGYTLYDDDRVKFLDPNYRAVPFTVEYTYEIDYTGLLNYPDMRMYDSYNISVENMSFDIMVPKDFGLRYLERNMTDSCVKTIDTENNKLRTSFKWIVKNKPALKEEQYSADLSEYTPMVYIAPEKFKISGYAGDYKTWKDFGDWILNINEGRTELSEETTNRIKDLLAQKSSEKEKIDFLYHLLQEKVRYVSIQVGLGGWQTIDAETIDRLSYGDCKALSNYMRSLLNIAGIKSYYTLVNAGDHSPDIRYDFPSNQFNHVIVCIPHEKDTTWLECTSQDLPAGYMGKFTDDRHVLLIRNEGGAIVKTRKYNGSENLQLRKADVTIDGEGNAVTFVSTVYKGLDYDEIYPFLKLDNADLLKEVQKKIPVKSFNVDKINYSEIRDKDPFVTEELNLTLPNYGTLTGNRILFNPNLMTRFGKLPYRTTDRKSIIRIKRPYTQTDTIVFKIPLSYRVEQVPENKKIVTKFGEYSTSVTYDEKRIIYVRSFKMFNGDFPVPDYTDFVAFCEKTSTMDDRKVVFIKLF